MVKSLHPGDGSNPVSLHRSSFLTLCLMRKSQQYLLDKVVSRIEWINAGKQLRTAPTLSKCSVDDNGCNGARGRVTKVSAFMELAIYCLYLS